MERGFQMRWVEVVRWWETGASPLLVKWWRAQDSRTRIAVVVLSVLLAVTVLNVVGSGVGRLASGGPAATTIGNATAPAALVAEAAPADTGKTWTVRGVWQGSGGRETEAFVVGQHWRVDWLYNPVPGGSLQIFIYHADGRLLMTMAANAQSSGADTSFWAGPGRYFLMIKSTGGDWKVDVQDLR